MFRTAQDIIRTGLVFTAKQRCRDQNAQEHEQKEIDAFILRHVGTVSRIKVKGHFHFFIHPAGNLLRSRIVFLFQPHQVWKMGTAALVKSEGIFLCDLRIVRREAAFRIRHDLMQSRDQFGVRQDFTVPDILREISVKIAVKSQILMIIFQSQSHFFRRYLSRSRHLQIFLNGKRFPAFYRNLLPVLFISIPFIGNGHPCHKNRQCKCRRQKKDRAPAP